MIHALDQIIVAATDPAIAAQAYAAILGQPGNGMRFELENTALQIIAADGPPEGLHALVFAVENMGAAREALGRRGLASQEPDTNGLVWLDAEATAGIVMALVERAREPARIIGSADTVTALDHVVVRAGDADRAVALYGARLGLDFRLDRSNPQWGARLLFFRCGASVIEISAPLGAANADSPDRLDGLAWRVPDPEAARARLSAAGFDVSDVRKGRKPGTAVFTLRSGVVGAPSLLIGPLEG